MLTNCPGSCQAHFRSHSGRNAGVVFAHAPTTAEFSILPHLCRVLLLERLQLPEATCNRCHEPLDTLGRHRAACTPSGRVKKRAGPTERVLARVCREAGARVKFNALRDMNLGVPGGDERRIEVVAQDLPCFGGAELAVDITLEALCARQVNLNVELLRLMAQSWCEHGATRKTRILSWSLQGVAAWWWWPLRQGAVGVTKERISCGNWRRRRRGAGTLVPLDRTGFGTQVDAHDV